MFAKVVLEDADKNTYTRWGRLNEGHLCEAWEFARIEVDLGYRLRIVSVELDPIGVLQVLSQAPPEPYPQHPDGVPPLAILQREWQIRHQLHQAPIQADQIWRLVDEVRMIRVMLGFPRVDYKTANGDRLDEQLLPRPYSH